MDAERILAHTSAVAAEIGHERWRALTTREQVAIVKDVLAIVDDPTDDEEREASFTGAAVALLRRRIGGWANVKSYARCLVAGEERRMGR